MNILKIAAAFGTSLVQGPPCAFVLADSVEWNGRGVQRLLRRNGIKGWACMNLLNGITFTVKRCDAERARCIMQGSGVPLVWGT